MRTLAPNARITTARLLGGAILACLLLVMMMNGYHLTFAQSPAIDYPEGGTHTVAVFTATDPELAGAITWSLEGDDAEDFEIGESSGVLTFAEVPDYEMAADGDSNNVYAVTVVATDADGMATNEAVTVTVTNVDEAGTVTLSAVAPYPGVALTTTHTDPDGQIAGAEWQWSRSRSKSGSYAAIADAEAAAYTPESGDVGFYLRATVTYNDGEGEDKSTMATSAHTVQAINLPNRAPAFPDQDPETSGDQSDAATRMVEENTAAGEDVGLPVAADDADNDILTYTLGGSDADDFGIEPASGQILTKSDLDADTDASYTVTVTATDPAGDTDVITVTITVTGVNEAPEITGDVDDYAENGTDDVASFTATDPESAGAVTLDLSGADASLFTLTGGTLTFNSPPNYERSGDADKDNTYELTVGARDADGIRGTRDIEVKVTNVDEAGTVTLSAVQPRVGVAVTASLTDIDGSASGVTWQWSAGNSDIDDATSDTYTPTADDVGDTLRATAMYTDPQGPEKTASGDSAQSVASDTRNRAPVFDDQDDETDGIQNTEATRTIAENSTAGIALNGGGPVTATDPNTAALNDTVSYTLGGADASSFDIGLTTGQITVGTGTDLDYETKTTYMVTVIATDSYGESSSIAVTITVTDENEGPEVMLGGLAISGLRSITRAENNSAALATYTSTGPESASTTWSLSGDDAADFNISSGGELSFAGTPDFENPADAAGDNVYEVTIEAADGTYTAAPQAVTVTVTNVEEPGTVTLSPDPQVGVELTATLTDPDGGVTGETWQWARDDGAGGDFEDIADATSAAYTPVADDEGKLLRATVTYTDGEGADKSAVGTSAAVAPDAPAGDPLVARYDADNSGEIERNEVITAINEYLDGGTDAPTRAEVIRLINLYLDA